MTTVAAQPLCSELHMRTRGDCINPNLQNKPAESGLSTEQGFGITPEMMPDRETQICHHCRAIDFQAIFRRHVPPDRNKGQYILSLDKHYELRSLTNCPICKLFADVCPEYDKELSTSGTVYELIAYSSNTGLKIRLESPLPESTYNTVLAIIGKNKLLGAKRNMIGIRNSIKERYQSIFQGLIVPVLPESPTASKERDTYELWGRLVQPYSINYVDIRKWIQHCEKYHEKCRFTESLHSVPIRVIDCDSRIVIPLPQNMPYLALSYVWGPSTSHIEQTQGINKQDPKNWSKTIEDAILVVQNLGYHYLWADKYCIDQDNAQEKHLQIGIMDQIYSKAVASIVAVAGDNADAGLPGVSSIPRDRQPQAETNGGLLVSTLPHVSHFLAKSTWSKRGWTYQEAILSRRCLFFTIAQVYYVCRTTHQCESAARSSTLDTRNTPLPDSLTVLGSDIFDPKTYLHDRHKTELNRQPTLYRQLCEYTKRQLSYDSDSLKAFKGILTHSGFYSYWGIIIVPSIKYDVQNINMGFACGLCWEVDRQTMCHTRRAGFPTWSWTSIDGQIDYSEGVAGPPMIYARRNEGRLGLGPIPDNLRFSANFSLEMESGEQKPLADLISPAEGKGFILPELTCYLHVETHRAKFCFYSTCKESEIVEGGGYWAEVLKSKHDDNSWIVCWSRIMLD